MPSPCSGADRCPTLPEPTYVSGLDLGQTTDYTAVAVLEKAVGPDPDRAGRRLSQYTVRAPGRWPLGTPYPEIIADLGRLYSAAPLRRSLLAVDATGVGRAVVDLVRAAKVEAALAPLTITAGLTASRNDQGEYLVPKKDLVGVLQVLFQTRRLKVVPSLAEAQTLVKELETFRVKVTAAANEVFGNWREGQHDDLVLAVGVAAWMAERGVPGGGWVCPGRGAGSDPGRDLWDRMPIPRPLGPWGNAGRGGRFMGVG